MCVVTYSDIMIRFVNSVGQENTANKTVKPGEATQVKAPQQQEQSDTPRYLQEDNTCVVMDNGKQITGAVFIDLDKDKRAFTCCSILEWTKVNFPHRLFLHLFTFPRVQFVTAFTRPDFLSTQSSY